MTIRKNQSIATPTKVQVQNSRSVYIYNPNNVYIAYGCAILTTLLCVLVGCISLFRNNAAYSLSLSTILRLTRDKTFDLLISKEDRGGEDPLPKSIAKARVEFNVESTREKGFKVLGYQVIILGRHDDISTSI